MRLLVYMKEITRIVTRLWCRNCGREETHELECPLDWENPNTDDLRAAFQVALGSKGWKEYPEYPQEKIKVMKQRWAGRVTMDTHGRTLCPDCQPSDEE